MWSRARRFRALGQTPPADAAASGAEVDRGYRCHDADRARDRARHRLHEPPAILPGLRDRACAWGCPGLELGGARTSPLRQLWHPGREGQRVEFHRHGVTPRLLTPLRVLRHHGGAQGVRVDKAANAGAHARTASLWCTPGPPTPTASRAAALSTTTLPRVPPGRGAAEAEALNAARVNELPVFAVARRPAGMSGTSPQGRSASRLNKPAELRSPRTRDGERTIVSRRTLTRGGPKSWGQTEGAENRQRFHAAARSRSDYGVP